MRLHNISYRHHAHVKQRVLMPFTVLVFFLVLTGLSCQAYAVQKEGGRCILSAEVLANPDLVIQDAMKNSTQSSSKNCNDVGHSDRATYFAERKLIKSYPIEGKKIPNAGWGIYRDFKIHGFQDGPDLEGSKTRIYDVELIYIAMTTIDSTVPICERSRVPMRVVHTPWGWRFMNQFSFGSNLQAEIRGKESKVTEAKNPAYRYAVGQISYLEKWSKEEIDRLNDFANRCQLTLQ